VVKGKKLTTGQRAVARAAWERKGAGKHGGTVRQKNRRDRKAARQAVRS